MDKEDYLFKEKDIIIISHGTKLYFYKDVLIKNSNVFAQMLSHGMKENKDGKIEISNEYDVTTVTELLKVLHPLIQYEITRVNVFMLIQIAHHYQFHNILKKCISILNTYYETSMTTDNVISAILQLQQLINYYSQDGNFCGELECSLDNLIMTFAKCSKKIIIKDLVGKLPKEILERLVCELSESKCVTVDNYDNFIKDIRQVMVEHYDKKRLEPKYNDLCIKHNILLPDIQ
ncbi:MAG: hypothetical protein Edafosvirus1_126 [Edafosvirus sp.]|uniref:BTB domain-containing protein n=1 Tax=Edafosvirus sp. TaxID=2487765 RepID=A0A3G4ZSD3_9VIRU|nr:MAG: hypothetical protein Edafosvirus1_126 [Edafosvirus sp.]